MMMIWGSAGLCLEFAGGEHGHGAISRVMAHISLLVTTSFLEVQRKSKNNVKRSEDIFVARTFCHFDRKYGTSIGTGTARPPVGFVRHI